MPPQPIVRAALASSIIFSLAACNPPQPLNFSVQNVQPSPVKIDADLKAVTVTPAAPNERTGSLPPGVAGITNTWKEATQEALARTAIFNDDSHRHVNLEVKILKFDIPGAGFTFPTYTDARYSLIDRSTGQSLFSKVVSAEGETPMDFSFFGAVRGRESINRSAQNNIAGFVSALEHGSSIPGAAAPAPLAEPKPEAQIE
jgi:hypothetical protein